MVLKYWIEDFSLFLIHIASIWHFQHISVQVFHNSSGFFFGIYPRKAIYRATTQEHNATGVFPKKAKL